MLQAESLPLRLAFVAATLRTTRIFSLEPRLLALLVAWVAGAEVALSQVVIVLAAAAVASEVVALVASDTTMVEGPVSLEAGEDSVVAPLLAEAALGSPVEAAGAKPQSRSETFRTLSSKSALVAPQALQELKFAGRRTRRRG